MKLFNISLFFTLLFSSNLTYSQSCVEFLFESTISGADFVNFEMNPSFEVCEKDHTIKIGSEEFYFDRGKKNIYGDFYYPIQESFYTPEIGYVKVGSKMNIVELKFMNSVVQYSIISPQTKELKDKISAVENMIKEQKRIENEKIQIQEDVTTKSKIESYLKEKNINAAISENNKLHFKDISLQNRIEIEIEKINKIEDNNTINDIEKYLTSNKIDEAIGLYKKLHYVDLDTKNKIQKTINQYYENLIIPIDNNLLNTIISDNKITFSKINDGKYSIFLRKNGDVNIEKDDFTNKTEICRNISYLQKNGFEYPSTYKGEILITTDLQKIAAGDSVRYIIPENYKKKHIYVSKKGDYYFGKFSAPLTAKMLFKPQFYDLDTKGLNINFEQLNSYTKKVNDVKVATGKGFYLEKTFTAKKGTGRKIFRITTSPIWGPFYLYYLYTLAMY